MDGWIKWRIDGWMDKREDRWMDGRKDEWEKGLKKSWKKGWKGRMDRKTTKGATNGQFEDPGDHHGVVHLLEEDQTVLQDGQDPLEGGGGG